MTYQLVSAVAKSYTGDKQWNNVSIGDIPLNTLFATYSRVFAKLTNPFLTKPVSFDLENIRTAYAGLETTFNEFLIANGNTTLITSPRIITLKKKYVKYVDAFKAGYKVESITPRNSLSSNQVTQDKTWLYLTKNNINYSDLYTQSLVNVNGFFHLTDFDVNGLYVKDGMKSQFLSGENQIGFVDFAEVGRVTPIPILESMIYKQTPEQKYKDSCFINLGVDLTDKTIILCLGGYLHVLDPITFKRIGDQTFMINFTNLPLLERFHESKGYIDLSSLELDQTIRNDSQVSIEQLYSDDVLVKYLTLSQSFFVLVDNIDLSVTRAHLDIGTIPNKMISDIKPSYPLIVGYGKLANFWSVYEDKKWSIACADSMRNNYLHNTIDFMKENSCTNSRLTQNPVNNSKAYFLQIYSNI